MKWLKPKKGEGTWFIGGGLWVIAGVVLAIIGAPAAGIGSTPGLVMIGIGLVMMSGSGFSYGLRNYDKKQEEMKKMRAQGIPSGMRHDQGFDTSKKKKLLTEFNKTNEEEKKTIAVSEAANEKVIEERRGRVAKFEEKKKSKMPAKPPISNAGKSPLSRSNSGIFNSSGRPRAVSDPGRPTSFKKTPGGKPG